MSVGNLAAKRQLPFGSLNYVESSCVGKFMSKIDFHFKQIKLKITISIRWETFPLQIIAGGIGINNRKGINHNLADSHI